MATEEEGEEWLAGGRGSGSVGWRPERRKRKERSGWLTDGRRAASDGDRRGGRGVLLLTFGGRASHFRRTGVGWLTFVGRVKESLLAKARPPAGLKNRGSAREASLYFSLIDGVMPSAKMGTDGCLPTAPIRVAAQRSLLAG